MKVLVTGATGHVGQMLCAELVETGYAVVAGVHGRKIDRRVQRLLDLGAEIAHLDIMAPDSLFDAMNGVEAVFHVAAIVNMWAPDPEREIIEPNVRGARNVVQAAARRGIARVVMTSSVAAIGAGRDGERPLGPEDWNHLGVTAYARSKTLAELQARHDASVLGVDLVTVNPGSVIGPGFFAHTPSTLFFSWLRRGLVRAVLPVTTSYVDSRSLAFIHRRALEVGGEGGRYVAVDCGASLQRVAEIAAAIDSTIPIPVWKLPERAMPLLAYGDAIFSKLGRRERTVTRAMIAEFGGRISGYETTRTCNDLGWTPAELTTSVEDTLAWMDQEQVG
jgi:dihydroflavonol-4-reductase